MCLCAFCFNRGVAIMGKVVTWSHAGVDPKVMGTGPIPAIKKAVRFSTVTGYIMCVQFTSFCTLTCY